MTTDLSVLSEYQAAGFELLDVFPVNRYEELGFVLEYDCLMARSGTRISPRLLPQGHQAAEATGW